METIQFSHAEALAQVKRICANRLFAKSANLQAFLEFLVTRRISGTENLDEYSGKQLAFEFFKRDTSIAKVEGNKLRKRLRQYYEGQGRKDDIVIQIPPGPYRPEIVASPHTLPDLNADAAELVWAAGLLEPRREAAFYADRLLDKALTIHPGHPRLLGLKAKLYADMMFIPGFPHKAEILGVARKLVNEARDTGVIPWEVSYADAALKAILDWDWKGADDAFRYANALSANIAPYGRWYLTFLMSQRRFRESMHLLQKIVEGTPTRWVGSNHEVFTVRAMFEMMAGLDAESTASLIVSEHLFPFIDTNASWAFNCEAHGLVERAVDYLSRVKPIPDIFDIMVTALKATCEGQLGHMRKARAAYNKIVADDAHKMKAADDPLHKSSFWLAAASIGLCEPEAAVDYLIDAAKRDRDPMSLFIGVFPPLRHLYYHPRLRHFMEHEMRLKLAPGASSTAWPRPWPYDAQRDQPRVSFLFESLVSKR